MVKFIAKSALDKKGGNIVTLDLRKISTMVDYFIIITGTSDKHSKAIADDIGIKLGKEGIRKWHIEGYSYGHWILLDYVDVVVHIFLEEERLYYNIESLWGDALIERIEEENVKS
ncbi:ribosome silencing factor [candidate division WOR-3 bacterium]|nr:ribosome silencing factor [candidate division WOR-3 bacterium]